MKRVSTYYLPNMVEIDLFEDGGNYYAYNAHGYTKGALALFVDRYPSYAELCLHCYNGDGDTFNLYLDLNNKFWWVEEGGTLRLWEEVYPPPNPWDLYWLDYYHPEKNVEAFGKLSSLLDSANLVRQDIRNMIWLTLRK